MPVRTGTRQRLSLASRPVLLEHHAHAQRFVTGRHPAYPSCKVYLLLYRGLREINRSLPGIRPGEIVIGVKMSEGEDSARAIALSSTPVRAPQAMAELEREQSVTASTTELRYPLNGNRQELKTGITKKFQDLFCTRVEFVRKKENPPPLQRFALHR